jgi:hypothetical protein
MKTVWILIIAMGLVTAGYFGGPILIENYIAGLRSETNEIKQRLLKIEEFVKKEEEAKKAAFLPSDADAQRIIKSVNAISSKVVPMEENLKKALSRVEETVKNEGTVQQEALNRQSNAVDKTLKEINSRIQLIILETTMASVKGHILKVQAELRVLNLGAAKTEVDLIDEFFEKTKTLSNEQEKKTIGEFQGALKKAKEEINTDLPAAINRIDLLWHDISRWTQKG